MRTYTAITGRARVVMLAMWLAAWSRPVVAAEPIDFQRDVRPILSNNCFLCHGPDASQRKGSIDGLRLDTREGLFGDLGGYQPVVPGDVEASELVRRITAEDDAERMPPVDSGKVLTQRQIQILTRWVEEGAPYQRHWSYERPRRPPLPDVRDRSWPRNEIDYFILARLEHEGLNPSPEADRYALARRVSLDLTGLPLGLEEVDQFVADADPRAYEKLVDRLLQNESYGEHWARMWLDLARYADSAGYADDPPRTIWAYRDYVIRSFNANKPFDRFTIEQVAGDLLPDVGDEELIATAFHRNTLTNNEGGTNDEEFRNVAVVDRVNTTMAVWMGTTINCAQCHDHKYDPISQEEFYRFFAFFNNTADADKRDEGPLLELYTDEQKQKRQALQEEIAQLEEVLRTPTAELRDQQVQWEGSLSEQSSGAQGGAKDAKLPEPILQILETPRESRTAAQNDQLTEFYLSITPSLKPQRDQLAILKKQLDELKPVTTVPIFEELPDESRRITRIQHRGNFLDLGKEVTAGVPEVFHALPDNVPFNRLALAKWLIDDDNPLTGRVLANRFWEQIFGVGIVRTSEEFGSQGELPTHPELLDWLATELRRDWDIKRFLKLLVTSATYRQSSRLVPELLQRDPDNVLLARGPRFRLPAETVRDQALFVAGLLSPRMYGPPVRPPQPKLGVNAAFGSGIDWQPSEGEDRYRRAIYTTWRRSNPYPSMVTFDAPNREVCTLRRARTNTPLQALVTLNDPVYIEAAQGLARRMTEHGQTLPQNLTYGFRLCLVRPPTEAELARLVELYQQAAVRYTQDAELARHMATRSGDREPEQNELVQLAAYTLVGNVLLNLDETLMKR